MFVSCSHRIPYDMCYTIMCIPITIGLQPNPDHWSMYTAYPHMNDTIFPFFRKKHEVFSFLAIESDSASLNAFFFLTLRNSL